MTTPLIRVWDKENERYLSKFYIGYDEAEYLKHAGRLMVYLSWLAIDNGEDITDYVEIHIVPEKGESDG